MVHFPHVIPKDTLVWGAESAKLTGIGISMGLNSMIFQASFLRECLGTNGTLELILVIALNFETSLQVRLKGIFILGLKVTSLALEGHLMGTGFVAL